MHNRCRCAELCGIAGCACDDRVPVADRLDPSLARTARTSSGVDARDNGRPAVLQSGALPCGPICSSRPGR